jgi:glycosyltransferase involved in cell wall biosynthesis
MKLVVQVPCLNEEATLPTVLSTIPRHVDGIDEVVVVVIDDGSTDRTTDVAFEHGADVVITHVGNRGLARSFRDGVDFALSIGADIVVNTDGDNQYPQARIGDLVEPIVAGRADIVIGDRQTHQVEEFSPFKKLMQRVGSRVVSRAARVDLPDAASGFRAYSRTALMRINVLTTFSYCMETIIQAGNRQLRIESVAIDTNPKTRESRLFRNIWHHMFKSGVAIVRSVFMFRPFVLLSILATVLGVAGLVPFLRFFVFFLQGEGDGHLQSLIFGSSMLVAAFVVAALLIIADLLRTNRLLVEETLERTKHLQYDGPDPEGAGTPTATIVTRDGAGRPLQTSGADPAR